MGYVFFMRPFIPSLFASVVFHECAEWDIHGDMSEMLLEWKTCFQSDTHAKRTKKIPFSGISDYASLQLGKLFRKGLTRRGVG